MNSTVVDRAKAHTAVSFQYCLKYLRAIIDLLFLFRGPSQPSGEYEESDSVILDFVSLRKEWRRVGHKITCDTDNPRNGL